MFSLSQWCLNMDCLSHVDFSDGLVSSDGPRAQLVILGHSPYNSPSKLRFLSPSEEKRGFDFSRDNHQLIFGSHVWGQLLLMRYNSRGAAIYSRQLYVSLI